MQLNLYRRHSRVPGTCVGGHAPDSRSYEAEERRRGHRKCLCPIYANGTLDRTFKRKNTKRTAWEEAKLVAAEWEEHGSWNTSTSPSVIEPTRAITYDSGAVTTAQAVEAYLEEHARTSAPNTLKKYRHILHKLTAYAEGRGLVSLHHFRPFDVREFRHSWTVSPLTASKNLSVVKGFFEFAVANEWIDRNPARMLRPPRGQAAARVPERVPFSDEELERMYIACRTRYGREHAYRYRWDGQDLEDFISVSVYTGLRISDVATFHIDRLKSSGECHIRTTKNGRHVYTWVPEWLQDRMRLRSRDLGTLIFGEHETDDINVITDVWRRKLKRLWSLCGPWQERPTPHRFRHTFARILLERSNVNLRDVAELLGDTEEMVRRHYAAWVPERQERLTAVLREAFADKPRPRLVKIG